MVIYEGSMSAFEDIPLEDEKLSAKRFIDGETTSLAYRLSDAKQLPDEATMVSFLV